jgi:hypothetical protein
MNGVTVDYGDQNTEPRRTMKNKKGLKGQMKIKQMAFMLIAVTVLISMLGMFLLMIRIEKIKDDVSELQQENAILLASKLANSPEFSCGEAFGTQRSNCVDFDKIMMLKNNIWKYDEFWGVENIELRLIHSLKTYRARCTMSNYPRCGEIVLVDKPVTGYDVSTFVTVCRKEIINDRHQEICNLGKLFVRYSDVK